MRCSLVQLVYCALCLPVALTFAEGLEIDPYAADHPDLGEPRYVAQVETDHPAADEAAQSEQCRAFAQDINADLGEVLKAGCEPTLAQMSALMDNPLFLCLSQAVLQDRA